MKKVCICGGGSLGHVTAGYLSAKGSAEVNILTGHPESWQHSINVLLPDGRRITGDIGVITHQMRRKPLEMLTWCCSAFQDSQ